MPNYIARVERSELGVIYLRIVGDDEEVLLKQNDEFVTFTTKVNLRKAPKNG